MVERRWAITNTVRPFITRASASWISASVSESSELVASSSIMTGASLRIARAMAMRWRSPPDRRVPRAPTIVS